MGIQSEFTGQADQAPPDSGASEQIGFLAAIIVLLIVFRTATATAVPILFASISLATAFMLLFIAARFTTINTVTQILVPMIGIGVGIDYTLFIVTRFRQALHDGANPRDAAIIAASTAGRAVIFAGVTVAISITGLATLGMDFITKMGFGSALGVLTAVVLATVLLPAVLAKLGHRIDRLKVPFIPHGDESEEARERSLLGRWGNTVVAHPRLVLGVALGVLAIMILPMLNIQLGVSDNSTAPKETVAAPGLRPPDRGFRAGLHRPDPDRRRPDERSRRDEAHLRRRQGDAGRGGRVRPAADLQRRRAG